MNGTSASKELPGSILLNVPVVVAVTWLFFFFFLIYFLAMLDLLCCVQAFSSCGEQGLLFVAVCGLLIAVASLVAEHGL